MTDLPNLVVPTDPGEEENWAAGHGGDCFTVSAGIVCGDKGTRLLRDISAKMGAPFTLGPKSPFRIVHGLPVGRGPVNGGKRYWHAWVERAAWKGQPAIVLDYSGGNDRGHFFQHVYYEMGELTEDHVFRYTPAEALDLFAASGHCGPWPWWEDEGYDWIEAMVNVNEGREPIVFTGTVSIPPLRGA